MQANPNAGQMPGRAKNIQMLCKSTTLRIRAALKLKYSPLLIYCDSISNARRVAIAGGGAGVIAAHLLLSIVAL